ncbi:MBL fold metallo-hydrolase [Salinigranum salinum]|uniref:MBL fold metallo-hydrolase n=1 Tax=Salinigranum salinum TaxID=1364937 RepID=UPI0012612E0F|nr:MBL fold metallo-hydrolase [Salinigranum salinum]
MALPPSVHLLPLEFEHRGRPATLSPVAIETDRGLLLVDTGLDSTVDQLEARLDDAGFGLEDLRLVLLTHQDVDHVDALATITDRVSPVVVASTHAAQIIDGREEPRGGVGRGRPTPVPVDVELDGWGTIDTRAGPARVVPTPGHTPGHVSLYFPDERLLVAADALTADGGVLQGPRPEMSEEMELALESVGRLAELDVDHVVCYHGGSVEAGSDRIAEIAAGE